MRAKLCFIAVAGLAVALALGCGAGKPKTTTDADNDIDGDNWEPPPDLEDQDGDTIADEHEGRLEGTDTDGDGTPDWQDLDSDDDTIPDSTEGGDAYSGTPPRDGDLDGTPDFRDLDSDDNGIPDETDSLEDTDADTILDFSEIDDDADAIPDEVEIGGDPASPEDFDGDTVPDLRDIDSDDDTIGDLHEGRAGDDFDFDEDTIPDRHDLDTDGDGWTDEEEAGDDDPTTEPANTDGDDWPDFRDLDSDADGLSDEQERESGTSRDNPDTDGDGVSDLIEVGYGSDPLDPDDSPRTHGDFVFTVPYNDPTDPPPTPLDPVPIMDTLVFSTDIQQADVFFLVDTTGSMGGEIANLTSGLSTYIIPQVQAEITDVWFGVAGYDDYPVSTYGTPSAGDLPFYLRQRMTSSASDAQTAVAGLTVHNGLDLPESTVPALWVTATGSGIGGWVPVQDACGTGEFGYPCFRPGAVPIIVLITDAQFHNDKTGQDAYSGVTPVPPTYAEALTELLAARARVLGVCSGAGDSMRDLEDIARDTGAVADMGGGVTQPLVTQILPDGTQLREQVVLNIRRLANQVPIEISTEPRDVNEGTWDTVDATVFIDRIVPNTTGGVEDPVHPGVFCVAGLATADTNSDGYQDVFTSVFPGTTVCFDIWPLINTSVPSTEEVQIFQAEILVIGDGYTTLDVRSVYFLIPPEIEEPILG